MARRIQVKSLHCCVVEFFPEDFMKRNNLLHFCFFVSFFLWPVKLGCEDGGRGAIILWKSTGFFISFSGRIKRSTSWTKRWTLTSEECCRVLKDFILQCPLWYSLQLSLVVRSKSKTVERERGPCQVRRIYNKDAIPTAKDRIHWKVPFWKAAFCFTPFFTQVLKTKSSKDQWEQNCFWKFIL